MLYGRITSSEIRHQRILRLGVFVMLFFALSVPKADARIVVEGNRQFMDDVNECINTYRNTPGLVGDAIQELERSGNAHRITEAPDWENSANDATKASNGTGSGTHTKVDRAALERIKQRVPELANKDFCTALLHELWHAVDADRGTWSNTKLDEVWEDEIEATIFQNFIHALRGVPPRTSYGRDISRRLGITPEETRAATHAEVEVLVIGSAYYPKEQFHAAGADVCEKEHWHAAGTVNGVSFDATDGSVRADAQVVSATDPDPRGCGFGPTDAVPVRTVWVPNEVLTRLRASIPASNPTIEVIGLEGLKMQ